LYDRGFTDETIQGFEVGFSPDAVVDYLAIGALNYSDLTSLAELEHLFQQKNKAYSDKFRNRITFPLKNANGQALGFAAREIDGSMPKYLNSAESGVYQKSRCLYGLQLAAPHMYGADYAILCEGYTDAMAFHQTGHKMAVACGGTYATKQQLSMIGRYTNKLYLSFDADEAGDGVTNRTSDLARSMGFRVGFIDMERGKDPAEALLGS
jgi:DNA primase